MKSIKIIKLGTFSIFFLLIMPIFGLLSCSSDGVTVNEGVADDGTPLGPGTELSAGLEEDVDPDAQLVGLEEIESDGPKGHSSREFQVTAYKLNVRRGPANTFPVVRILRKNQIVKGKLTESGWIRLSSEEFVSPKFLKSK
ncbi:MAG: hypothetical protein AB8G05_28165 [Oligoflexales bacterium]